MSAPKKTAVPPALTIDAVAACNELFGQHPEDVITPIKTATDALDQVYEILKTIEKEALEPSCLYRLKRLADAGATIAFEAAEFSGTEHERMISRLREAGVAP